MIFPNNVPTTVEVIKEQIAFAKGICAEMGRGKSELPAFLMHDSPREADLGESIYHLFFHLLHELEGLGKEAPFQYIITTTTEPPKEMQDGDSLAAILDGADAENKLLRRDFTGGLDAS